MKKYLVFLSLFFAFSQTFAQDCSAVFFNQNGDRFKVIMNGILQNINYETNVKITDLHFDGSYKVTIAFENEQLPDITKNIFLMDRNSEYTYIIKQNNKGKYVLRSMGIVPLNQNATPAPSQSVIVYSTSPPPAQVTSSTTTVSSTTTTSSNSGINSGDQVSMGINVNESGVNLNLNIQEGMNNGTITTHSSSTTTTTEQTGAAVTEDHYIMPGYNGPIGCSYPMSDSDFNAAKTSISTKVFSESKMALAKQITNTNCLTSEQAKQIIELFDFEDARLEYAKYAYGYTFDLGNYYKVNDAFEFESTIDALNDFIEGF